MKRPSQLFTGSSGGLRLALAWMSILLAFGCHGLQNILAPAGPGARSLAFLARVSIFPFLAVTIITWAILLAAALRRRGSLEQHEPIDAGGGQGWILIGG